MVIETDGSMVAARKDASAEHGKALAELIMTSLAGRAGIRLGGQIVQWDSRKGKHAALCIDNSSIPCHLLANFLTEHEEQDIDNLPDWSGSNSYEISLTCLGVVSVAISRYQGPDEDSDATDLARCYCKACMAQRESADSQRDLISDLA